tara:strand:- start:15837 stop:18050 length:2214 start_codon:yes stop_codon:yes gene_type:complete
MASRYTIQKGDTLSEISKNLGISMQEIAALNKIEDVDFIKAGEELVLPEPRESLLQEPAPEPIEEAPEPVAEAPEPVVEAPEPVAEALAPIAEAPEPATEAPESIEEIQEAEDERLSWHAIGMDSWATKREGEDTVVHEIAENVSEALKERSEKLPGIVEDLDPDRPIMQVAVRTAGHIAGAVVSDIVGETIGTAGRRYVPQDIQDTYDAAVLSVATTLAETETGQKFLKHLEENPGDAKDLEAILDTASIIPAAGLAMKTPSAIGKIGRNLDTEINLYESPKESLKALARGGVKSTVVSLLDAVSAKRQASIRALAGGSLYKTREALKRLQDIKQYGEAAAIADAFLTRQSPQGTYKVLESANITFDQTPLGVKYFEPGGLDIPATDTDKISRVMAKGYTGPKAPTEVLKHFLEEMPSIWKVKPEITSVNVQRLGGPRSMFLEASPTVIHSKASEKSKIPVGATVSSPRSTSGFSEILGSQLPRVINSKRHPKGWAKSINKKLENMDENDWKAYLTSLEFDPLPFTEEGQKMKNKEAYKKNKLNPKFWEADGKKYVSFQQSHTSTDKVLAGVNDFMTLDITGGKKDIKLYTIISDAHDLKVLGKDFILPGGSQLINVFPAVTHNISKGVTYNVKDKHFKSSKSVHRNEAELAAQQLEEATGIKRLDHERGSAAQLSKYQRRVMLEVAEGATPLLKDRARAASNISLLTAAPTTLAFGGEQREGKVLRSLRKSSEDI